MNQLSSVELKDHRYLSPHTVGHCKTLATSLPHQAPRSTIIGAETKLQKQKSIMDMYLGLFQRHSICARMKTSHDQMRNTSEKSHE